MNTLTPAGKRLVEMVGPKVRTVQEQVVAGLSRDEAVQVITLLHRFTSPEPRP